MPRSSVLVGLVVLASLSLVALTGCLGFFGDSPEEVREDFEDRFEAEHFKAYGIQVEAQSRNNISVLEFEGELRERTVRKSSTGRYQELTDDGSTVSAESYSWEVHDGSLTVSVGNRSSIVEGVEFEDIGSVYEVDLDDRQEWSLVLFRDELMEVMQSEAYAEDGDVYLDADDSSVSGLLNRLFETGMGRSVIELSGDEVDKSEIRLRHHEYTHGEEWWQILIQVETNQGETIEAEISSN